MKRLQLALACAAVSLATTAMATPAPVSYSLTTTAPSLTTGGTGTSAGTSFANGSSSMYCTVGQAGCAAAGGTNYGNTYSWAGTSSAPGFTMSAWGTTTLSTTATIQKAWIGDYSPNGFGVTSQSTGELTTSHVPDASSPLFQHAIDDVNAYESLMFSFSSAVTLNSISIGFKGSDADATVLEYTGAGDPTTKLLTGESYADLLTNGWKIVGNLLNMSTGGTITGGTASKYWMVGAYLPIGANGPADGISDAFKVSGFTATRAVPEPGSIALFGIAGLAFATGRRRRARQD
jgi:PEP-CTERM motif